MQLVEVIPRLYSYIYIYNIYIYVLINYTMSSGITDTWSKLYIDNYMKCSCSHYYHISVLLKFLYYSKCYVLCYPDRRRVFLDEKVYIQVKNTTNIYQIFVIEYIFKTLISSKLIVNIVKIVTHDINYFLYY